VIHQQHPWSPPFLLSSGLRNLTRAVVIPSPEGVPRRVYFQCKDLESNLDCSIIMASSFRRETLPVRQNVLIFLLLLDLGPCETENHFFNFQPCKFAAFCLHLPLS
jgi:hypothetical protein